MAFFFIDIGPHISGRGADRQVRGEFARGDIAMSDTLIASAVILVIVIILVVAWQFRKGPPDAIPKAVKRVMAADGVSNASLFRYRGEYVFMFSAAGSDTFAEVYDQKGNRLGAPLGGITGRGDGKNAKLGEAVYVYS